MNPKPRPNSVLPLLVEKLEAAQGEEFTTTPESEQESAARGRKHFQNNKRGRKEEETVIGHTIKGDAAVDGSKLYLNADVIWNEYSTNLSVPIKFEGIEHHYRMAVFNFDARFHLVPGTGVPGESITYCVSIYDDGIIPGFCCLDSFYKSIMSGESPPEFILFTDIRKIKDFRYRIYFRLIANASSFVHRFGVRSETIRNTWIYKDHQAGSKHCKKWPYMP